MSVTTGEAYDYPEYYEIAFSFRDLSHEVNFLEQSFRKQTSPD